MNLIIYLIAGAVVGYVASRIHANKFATGPAGGYHRGR